MEREKCADLQRNVAQTPEIAKSFTPFDIDEILGINSKSDQCPASKIERKKKVPFSIEDILDIKSKSDQCPHPR